MPRQNQVFEGLFMEEDATKIRKRGCSPSSPSSSILHNYRFKKAVLVGKRGAGSSTPVPSWRVAASRSPSISLRVAAAAAALPRSQSGRSTAAQIQQPVSARKLAATLWELNEVTVAAPAPAGRRRRVDSVSGSLPPHLSDPSHSPVSERSDRSGTRTQRRQQLSSVSRRLSRNAIDVGVLDSVSNASFMEIETRSRCQSQAPAGGFRNHLKDVSNTLTTSKELLKIISRMWGQEDYQPSTSMSLISALHTELERARLQVNQLVQEQRTDQHEINYLVKCFAEEKAAWKNKEKHTIKAAIESIAGELEVERKLRRRVESLNKKLGNELAEIKALFSDAVKELESEKRARAIVEQVCNDLARDIGEDKAEAEEIQKDEVQEEDDQLREDLEAFLRDERGKEKAYHASINHRSLGFSPSEEEEEEVEDGESDLHSIEISMNRISKGHKSTPRSSKKLLADDELISGDDGGGRGLRRSTSLLRSVSNGVDCSEYGERLQAAGDGGLGLGYRRSCGDDLQRYKTVKGLRDQILGGSRLRDYGFDGSVRNEEGETKGRLEDGRVDSKSTRRSSRR